MKKRKTLVLCGIALAALLVLAAVFVFLVRPGVRENYLADRATGELELFCTESLLPAAADGLVLPLGYASRSGESTRLTCREGKSLSAMLWLWACHEEVRITDVSVNALWSLLYGNADVGHIRIDKISDPTVQAGRCMRLPISVQADEELLPGLWRAVVRVQAEGASGAFSRDIVLDIRITGEDSVKLCAGGSCAWTVVEKDDPTAAERTAADLLVRVMRESAGCEVTICKESDPVRGKKIYIGGTAEMDSDDELGTLGSENAYISVREDAIILMGGNDRGTLYAVCAFLEEYFGYRVYGEGIEHVDEVRRVDCERGDHLLRPSFELRAVYTGEGEDWELAMPAHLNGANLKEGAQYGGSLIYAGDCEMTLDSLIPATTYFYTNKKYYSTNTKWANNDTAQLCLSNESVQTLLSEKVLAMLAENPHAQRISLRHVSVASPCACETCSAVNRAEGSSAGTYLRLIDRIAEAVAKDYPSVVIEILLEGGSCTLPVTRPLGNVAPILSQAGTRRGVDYAGQESDFTDTVRAWCEVNPHVGVLLYAFNPNEYLQPVCELRTMSENLQALADLGVENCVITGCAGHSGAEWGMLKAYVAGRMLYCTDYPAALAVHDWLWGVYGDAAGYMEGYLALLADTIGSKKPYVSAKTDASIYDEDFFAQANALFDLARARAKGNGELLFRINRERMCLRYAELACADAGQRQTAEHVADVESFFADLAHYGITAISPARPEEDKARLLAADA